MVGKYRLMVAPFIGVLIIVLKLATGIELDADIQNQIIDAVTAMIAVVLVVMGIVKNNVSDK